MQRGKNLLLRKQKKLSASKGFASSPLTKDSAQNAAVGTAPKPQYP